MALGTVWRCTLITVWLDIQWCHQFSFYSQGSLHEANVNKNHPTTWVCEFDWFQFYSDDAFWMIKADTTTFSNLLLKQTHPAEPEDCNRKVHTHTHIMAILVVFVIGWELSRFGICQKPWGDLNNWSIRWGLEWICKQRLVCWLLLCTPED